MDQKILIDLDVLLDTRLGTLARLNPAAAQYLLEKDPLKDYHFRIIDDWTTLTNGLVDTETFKQAYRKRDVTTLKSSMLTNYVELIHAMTDTLESMVMFTPLAKSVTLEVNYWPYQLSPAELEMFQLSIANYTAIITEVRLVYYPVERLTPSVLKDGYSGYITYDYNEWAGYHQNALLTTKIPTVTIMAAALNHTIPTESDIAEMGIRDTFKAAETIMAEFVDLVLVSPRFYSIIELGT